MIEFAGRSAQTPVPSNFLRLDILEIKKIGHGNMTTVSAILLEFLDAARCGTG